MKSEILRSLIADGTLGELSPEVGELLDAYLEKDPAAAAEARLCRDTSELARRALKSSPRPEKEAALPAWKAPLSVSSWQSRRQLLALAACLAVGLLIGRFALPPGHSSPLARKPPAALARSTVVPAPHPTSTSLWSMTSPARSLTETTGKEELPLRVLWHSPITLPHFEQKP